jgi:hypothetical protein
MTGPRFVAHLTVGRAHGLPCPEPLRALGHCAQSVIEVSWLRPAIVGHPSRCNMRPVPASSRATHLTPGVALRVSHGTYLKATRNSTVSPALRSLVPGNRRTAATLSSRPCSRSRPRAAGVSVQATTSVPSPPLHPKRSSYRRAVHLGSTARPSQSVTPFQCAEVELMAHHRLKNFISYSSINGP